MTHFLKRMKWSNRRGEIESFTPIPGPALFSGLQLEITTRQVDSDPVAEDMIESFVDGNSITRLANRDDELDLIVKVIGLRRVWYDRVVVYDRVSRLQEEERRLAIGIATHFASMGRIVAARRK